MSSSNHHEKLLWTWSSASVLSLFLRHCISVSHCSLTNVQPALIKSNMCRLWPLRGSPGECPGEKWDIWKGWVHMERCGSHAALWAPSFSIASSDLIDLNLKKSVVIMTETHGWEGGAQPLTSLWPWCFREMEFEEGAETPEVLLMPWGHLMWLLGKPPLHWWRIIQWQVAQ